MTTSLETPTATPPSEPPVGRPARRRRTDALVLAAFGLAIFTGSLLVFLVQPMIARMMLPLFGGAAAVWNTALVFFQLVLLGGYAWAHGSIRWLGMSWQPRVQLLVLLVPALFLPFALPGNAAPPTDVAPALWVLYVLAVSVGVPYLVVSMASPMLQRWFAQVDHPAARDPYFLYAAGNVGSLLALLAYPILVEPNFTLDQQTELWAGIYVLFALAVAGCALLLRTHPGRQLSVRGSGAAVVVDGDAEHPLLVDEAAPAGTDASTAAGAGGGRALRTWQVVALAALPSALMIGVTTYVTTDLASIPFLWVVPLALYLLTFVIAFANVSYLRPRASSICLSLVVGLLMFGIVGPADLPLWMTLTLHMLVLFFGAMMAHGLLATGRPAAEDLTGFYLKISLGGVLGGAFAAIGAPVLFNDVWEYPLSIAAMLLAAQLIGRRPAMWSVRALAFAALAIGVGVGLHLLYINEVPESWSTVQRGSLLGVVALVAVVAFTRRPLAWALFALALLQPAGLVGVTNFIVQDRTFFGVVRVSEETGPAEHRLFSGTTMHGNERYGDLEGKPIGYYDEDGPIGDVFDVFQREKAFDQVGIVGLGSGGLAGYAEGTQRFVFYEIDPKMIEIARDPELFTFLSKAENVTAIEEDGRLGLADDPEGSYDLIVIDAFSSDAIPVHLLTVEAMEMYLSKLTERGTIAFHISARHVDLQPVILANALQVGVPLAVRADDELTPERIERGAAQSLWMIVAKDKDRVDELIADKPRDWFEPFTLDNQTEGRPWTDDYSNVLSVVQWGGLPYRAEY